MNSLLPSCWLLAHPFTPILQKKSAAEVSNNLASNYRDPLTCPVFIYRGQFRPNSSFSTTIRAETHANPRVSEVGKRLKGFVSAFGSVLIVANYQAMHKRSFEPFGTKTGMWANKTPP